MSLMILQTFKAAESRYPELAKTIADMLVATAARPGAEIVRAAGDPEAGVVTIFQQWGGPENQKAYTAWRMANTDMSALMALLREPPTIRALSRVF